MKPNTLWSIYGGDLKAMAKAVLSAAEVAKDIPQKDALIGIKPNLVVASAAENGATTHPEIAEGIIEYLKEQGFEHLCMLEGAWVGARTKDAADVCGYTDLAKKTGVPFIDTQPDTATARDCGGMEPEDLRQRAEAGLSDQRARHERPLPDEAHLRAEKPEGPDPEFRKAPLPHDGPPQAHRAPNAGLKTNFVLVDAVCGDLDYEEGGSPVQRDQIFGAYDPVLCDAYACTQLGYTVSDVPYIGIAEAPGRGQRRPAALEEIVLRKPVSPMRPPAPPREPAVIPCTTKRTLARPAAPIRSTRCCGWSRRERSDCACIACMRGAGIPRADRRRARSGSANAPAGSTGT